MLAVSGCRRWLATFAVLVAGVGVGCTKSADQPDLTGQDVHLTIIHTADIHSRLFPYQFAPGQIDKSLGLEPTQGDIAVVGGIARIATITNKIRSESERVIHLDSGDMFEGAPIFNYYGGEVEARAMTRLGVNAMALGNHEFDKGAVNLELMKAKFGGFPILAANYLFSDPGDPTQPKLDKVIQPFTIMNAQGLRIAVIGMGNLSSLEGIYEGGNSLGIRPLDTLQSIQDTVNLLRGSVDLVILVSHLGLDVDEGLAQSNVAGCGSCNSDAECTDGGSTCDLGGQKCQSSLDCPSQICEANICVGTHQCLGCVGDQNAQAAIEGVDVIFGGHLHIVLNPPNRIDHPDGTYTVICHSGAFAKYVGRLDLVVHVADPNGVADLDRKSHVKSFTYDLTPITDQIPEDGDMANMLEPYLIKMDLALNLGEQFAVVPCPANVTACPKIIRSVPGGTGAGDSQLGNLVATSMRLRKRVEADFGLTNSLGIRADFESGPLDTEEMYNVFPFDNSITTMFLSGNEIQQMLDFLAARASERGCKSQAQVSGIWYVSDCTNQVSCGPYDAIGRLAGRCHATDRNLPGTAPLCDKTASDDDPTCFHDGPPLLGDDCIHQPGKCASVLPFSSYRVAVNDYIANGGSGFQVLKRNTTKFNTGISLRDALSDYIRASITKRCAASDYSNLTDPKAGTPCTEGSQCTSNKCITPAGADCPVGEMDCKCTSGYDFTHLPCIVPDDPSAQASDGRITMVSP